MTALMTSATKSSTIVIRYGLVLKGGIVALIVELIVKLELFGDAPVSVWRKASIYNGLTMWDATLTDTRHTEISTVKYGVSLAIFILEIVNLYTGVDMNVLAVTVIKNGCHCTSNISDCKVYRENL